MGSKVTGAGIWLLGKAVESPPLRNFEKSFNPRTRSVLSVAKVETEWGNALWE